MLNNYFQHQAHIVDIECNFRCTDAGRQIKKILHPPAICFM